MAVGRATGFGFTVSPGNRLKTNIGVLVYPDTDLSRIAIEEGLISSEEELLFPGFYAAKGIEEPLSAAVEKRIASHVNWMY